MSENSNETPELDYSEYTNPSDQKAAELLDRVFLMWSDVSEDENGEQLRSPANKDEIRESKKILEECRIIGPSHPDLKQRLMEFQRVIADHERPNLAFLTPLITVVVVALIIFIGHTLQNQPAPKNFAVIPDTSGLLAWYPLSLKGEDAMGKGGKIEMRRITLLEDAFTGKSMGTAGFTGKKSRIRIPLDINPAAMPVLTFAVWIKPDTYGGDDEQIIFTHDDGGFDRSLIVKRDKTDKKKRTVSVAAYDGKGLTDALPIKLGEWNFVGATYNQQNKDVTVFSGDKTLHAPANIAQGMDYVLVGSSRRDRNGFKGLMDNILIFSRALSQTELDHFASMTLYEKPQGKEKKYVYIVTSNSVIVNESPDEKSKQLGMHKLGDTLKALSTMTSQDGKQKFIKINFSGQDGYVSKAYLDKVDLSESGLQAFVRKYVTWASWQFWISLVTVLLISFLVMKYYTAIDTALIRRANRSNPPGSNWPIMASMLSGACLAFFLVFWQTDVTHFINNFIVWPTGQAWYIWIVWAMLVIMAAVFIGSVVESIEKAGLVYGSLRAAGIIVLASIVFFSTVMITAALIVITILVIVCLIFLQMAVAGMSSKTVYTDSSGHKYVE
jgi:hypothetical protein